MTLPTFTFEAALGVGSGGYLILDDPVLGLLDTGLLGPDLVWTDLAADIRKLNIKTPKRDRTLQAYNAGTITAELADSKGNYDPTNTGSIYFQGGVTTLTPNRAVRSIATYAGVSYPMAYMYTNQWAPDGNDQTNYQWCNVTCTDGFKLLAKNNPVASGIVGTGELSGARITRILDNAKWSPALRTIAAGNSTMQGTNLSANSLTELQLTAASEQGLVFIDRSGFFTFLDRYDAVINPRSNTSQATFSDGAADPTALLYVKAKVLTDDALLINQVQLARAGGTQQVAIDPVSIAVYSSDVPASWGRSDLLNESDSEVNDMANWLLAQFHVPENRFTTIQLRGEALPATLWPALLSLRLRDRITAKRKRRGSTAFTQDLFVEGVEHDIKVSEKGVVDWVTTLTVSSTTAFGGYLVLDSATLGLLDTGLLAF